MTGTLAATIWGSLVTLAALGLPSRGSAQGPGGAAARALKPQRTGYVASNGVNYYYEIYGQGRPLLLLHGGLMSIG